MSLTPHSSEEARLNALYRYAILDTEPEAPFDRIVRLAQLLFHVPFVLITFIDRDRQWLKASYGVSERETELEASFCVHTIQRDQVMVVLDSHHDARFATMRVVTGPPFYRFYAGAPLTTPNGHNLGTLCVLDRVPHTDFSAEAQATLRDLAGVVMSELELRLTATEDAQRQLRRLWQMLGNITQVVRHQQDELLRVSRLKDEFVAKMSHELRTPLAAIVGFSELLREDEDVPLLTPEQQGYLEIIRSASQHLLALTDDLLDLSKLEAEMMALRPDTLQLGALIADAAEVIGVQLRRKGLQLSVRLPEGLAPLTADALKVKQVLYNLLSNAVKYTPAGGSIDLTVEDARDEVRLEVRDSGPGISEADQARLFRPFIQLHNAAESEFSGTGLGLVLVKQLVELHGGRVWLRSRLGEGATFGFSLPRVSAAASTGPEERASQGSYRSVSS